jgi:hypothetical protein
MGTEVTMYRSTICREDSQQQSGTRIVWRVISFAAILGAGLARAQDASQRPLIEHLSNSPPRESLFGSNSVLASQSSLQTNNDAAVPGVKVPRKELTSGDRWEKFEAEFGTPQKDPSLIKGSMESAKYQLDRALFGMQELVKDVQAAVSFDCELRSLGRSQAPNDRSSASSVPIPLWDTMERARFQSDIDLNMAAGRAFVGVRLVLPIGN